MAMLVYRRVFLVESNKNVYLQQKRQICWHSMYTSCLKRPSVWLCAMPVQQQPPCPMKWIDMDRGHYITAPNKALLEEIPQNYYPIGSMCGIFTSSYYLPTFTKKNQQKTSGNIPFVPWILLMDPTWMPWALISPQNGSHGSHNYPLLELSCYESRRQKSNHQHPEDQHHPEVHRFGFSAFRMKGFSG